MLGTKPYLQILIASGLMLLTPVVGAQATASVTTVTVGLQKTSITQHEPAIFDIAFTNSTHVRTEVDLGFGNEGIEITVLDPAGNLSRKKSRSETEGMKFRNAFDIPAGKSAGFPVLLNSWFSFDRVGVYRIEVTVAPRSMPAKRATLYLTVGPREESVLKLACASLLTRIKSGGSSFATMTYAEALASVRDPVAVPYLAEALDVRSVTRLMVNALVQLRTEEAVKVLEAASTSPDPETRLLAADALNAVGNANPPLRK